MNDTVSKMNPMVNKTSAAGVGGSIGVIAVYALQTYAGLTIPVEIATAIGSLCSWVSAMFVNHKA